MTIVELGSALAETLPRLKTKLQLSGLVVAVVLAFLTNFAKPGDSTAVLTAGGVGVSIIIFAQIFHYLGNFPPNDRAKLFLLSFLMFTIFILALLAMTVILIKRPTLSITQYRPNAAEIAAANSISQAARIPQPRHPSPAPNDPKIVQGKIVLNSLTPVEFSVPDAIQERDRLDAEYKYSVSDGVGKLDAKLGYSEESRSGHYPFGDFHNAISFGSPWLSFNVNNPTSDNIYLTLIKIEAISVKPIDEIILNVRGLPVVEAGKPIPMIIENEGWGKAKNATLRLRFARSLGGSRYALAREASISLGNFDKSAEIDLSPMIPPDNAWSHDPDFKRNKFCIRDGSLWIFAEFTYRDGLNKKKIETFRSYLTKCSSGGGGNTLPSIYMNVTLPSTTEEFPVFTPISECIAAKSAGKLVLRFLASRSSRYRLKFIVSDDNRTILERISEIDILVARNQYLDEVGNSTFLENTEKVGCT